jgi:predicted dehydrogenase
MSKQQKVGVVGCGYWGPNLIRNFVGLADCKLQLICDQDQSRLDHLTQLYPGVDATREFAPMLNGSDLDAIAIATPVHLHHSLAKQSLEAGKHTFIEKPMASSSEECQELRDIARKKKLTLMVGHTFLYSSPVRRIKEIIDHGDIGEVRYISARRLNLGLFQKDINVVWDLAPHDLSIILYLMGESPTAINCQGQANVTPGIEDVANMTLFFPSKGYATVHSSWLDPKKTREMTIVGSKRMIVYDDLEPLEKIKVYDARVERPAHYDTFADFHYSYHYGDMYAPHVPQSEPLKVECQHFLDCIRTGATPMSCGMRGQEIVQIMEAANQSMRNGGARVSFLPEDSDADAPGAAPEKKNGKELVHA